MSRAARDYVSQNHTLEQAALGYLHFLAPGVEVELAPEEAEGRRQKAERQSEITTSIVAPTAISSARGLNSGPSMAISATQNPLLVSIAEAAAEIGITEEHEAVLKNISTSLDGIIPTLEDGVARQ